MSKEEIEARIAALEGRVGKLETGYNRLMLIELNNIGELVGRSDKEMEEMRKDITKFIGKKDEIARTKSLLTALDMASNLLVNARELLASIENRDKGIKEIANRTVIKVRDMR